MDEYWFDDAAADHAVDFFERYLRHVKGRWAGARFRLEPWQRDEIVRPLFGWKKRNGARRYRTCYVEVPRKQGKSSLAAGIALYLTFAEGEPGGEVYGAAADRDQAAIVFDMAKSMVLGSPALGRRAKIYHRAITYPALAASYKVISADANTKHGFNASGVIFDELHAQKSRELWDVLNTSVGAREQPVVFAITTAGFDQQSICYEVHEHARGILNGTVQDDSFLPYICAAGPDDDWTDEAVWARANPSLGVTVTADFLRDEARRAEEMVAYQNTFRRLYLNQWTHQETRAIDLRQWDRSAGIVVPSELAGGVCYAGLDIGTADDLSALALVFPPENALEDRGEYQVLMHFWIAESSIAKRVRTAHIPYDTWTADGFIHATPGDVTDYASIQKKIVELAGIFDIRQISYDPHEATQLVQGLTNEGIVCASVMQGFRPMSAATKEMLRLISAGRLRHGGNPVLRWMADNLVLIQDADSNLRPSRNRSREKIDGIVALVMGLDGVMRNAGMGYMQGDGSLKIV